MIYGKEISSIQDILITKIMKRIIIICEGETEQEFCQKTLYNHFINKNILIQPINTKGIKPWEAIKNIAIRELKSSDVFVSTFYDFYGILPTHNFPQWKKAQEILDKNTRLIFLEDEMKKNITSRFTISLYSIYSTSRI